MTAPVRVFSTIPLVGRGYLSLGNEEESAGKELNFLDTTGCLRGRQQF